MSASLRERVARVLGAQVLHTVEVQGGYTPAQRWRATLGDGRSVFVKVPTTDYTAHALRREHAAYERLAHGPKVAPDCMAFDPDPRHPMLVLEDLGHGRWPPPWNDADLEIVKATVATVASLPQAGWPTLDLGDLNRWWRRIGDDPSAFLATGLCTPAWLQAALPALRVAEARADRDITAVLHFDLRSDNLCLLPGLQGGETTAWFVDWNHAGVGPAGLDVAFMAPSLRLEGGPLPDVFAPDAGDHATWVAGYFASQAGLPPIPDAPRVRRFQHRQLRVALPWVARVLGLDPPDGNWCRGLVERTDRALQAGTISEAEWHATIEEDLQDAYLSSDDPHRQSGKSGDAVDWRWSRELALDAVVGQVARVLDVGCANGHLMASFEAWGAQRGLRIEAHGLEISERMAQVARRRLPHLAARISTGNVDSWEPPMGYDLVHIALDCVPSTRRRALVRRVLDRFLAPGGRMVLRPDRADGPDPDPAEQLRALGFEPHGILQCAHPRTGVLRRTAWIGGTS